MATSSHVTTRDGIRLHTLRHGPDAPARVVLVHGLASNARLWDGVAFDLADRGIPTVAVDLRGHGESERPDGGYDMPTVADDVADVISAVASAPVVLGGQSWGGNVVLETAARHPGLVSGVACVDGGFIRLADDFDDMDSVWDALAPPGFDGLTTPEIDVRVRIRFDGWPETAITGALANFEEQPDGTVRARLARHRHRLVLEGMFDHDPDRAMAAVTSPVLMIVAGDSDHKRARVDAMQRAAGGRITVEWVDAHHDVHAQHPGLVADLIGGLG